MNRYEHEPWVPWYTNDTPGWTQLSLSARGACVHIACKLNPRTGTLVLRRGLASLAWLLSTTWEELEPALTELFESGKFMWDEHSMTLRDPDHGERKRPSVAERVARHRERKASSDVTPVTPVTLVTLQALPSGEVTPPLILSNLISSDLISLDSCLDPKDLKQHHCPPSEPGDHVGAGKVDLFGEPVAEQTGVRKKQDLRPDEVWDHYVATVKRYRPRKRPTSLTPQDRKTILALLKQGHTVDELKMAVTGMFLTPHYLGQNDRDTEYLELRHALKSAGPLIARAQDAEPPKRPPADPAAEQVSPERRAEVAAELSALLTSMVEKKTA